jgi:hypothetical protein
MNWLHKTSSWSRLIYMETRAWLIKVYSFAQWHGCKRGSYALRCGMCNEIGYTRKTCHIQQYMYDKKKLKYIMAFFISILNLFNFTLNTNTLILNLFNFTCHTNNRCCAREVANLLLMLGGHIKMLTFSESKIISIKSLSYSTCLLGPLTLLSCSCKININQKMFLLGL